MKALAEIFGGQFATADHAFDDVAMVAKNASGHFALMAMIGACFAGGQRFLTNGTAVVLSGKKGVERVLVEAGSMLPDFGLVLGVQSRVGFYGLPFLLSLSFCFFAAIPFVASSSDIRASVVFLTALSGLFCLVVGLRFFKAWLSVSGVAGPSSSKMALPLFGSAVRFPHIIPVVMSSVYDSTEERKSK